MRSRAGKFVALIAAGTAIGSATGGLVLFIVSHLVNLREEAQREHMEWNQEIAADLAGGIRMTRRERDVLRDIEWAEAPAMNDRLDDVCNDYQFFTEDDGGEESSSSS